MLAGRCGQVELYRHITARNDAGARHRDGDRAILMGLRLGRGWIAIFGIGHGGGAHSGTISA